MESYHMEKELSVLRRVAQAAKKYQEIVIQKRSMLLNQEQPRTDTSKGLMEVGSAEFELSEALNEWYRTQYNAD